MDIWWVFHYIRTMDTRNGNNEMNYRGIKIIVSKANNGYQAHMFHNNEIKAFDRTPTMARKAAISFAEIIIDGKIEDGYI